MEYYNEISVEDYCELREAVEWPPMPKAQAASGLEHSDYIIACKEGDNIVGAARVFWDKGYIAYLADVMVKPEYQGRGIGKKLVAECIGFVDSVLNFNNKDKKIKVCSDLSYVRDNLKEGFGVLTSPNIGKMIGFWRNDQNLQYTYDVQI